MNYNKKIMLVFLAIPILLSACRSVQRADGSEASAGTEPAAENTSISGQEEILVWRMNLPVSMEETDMASQLVGIWQEPLNALLKEKGAGYQVEIELLGMDGEFAESDTSVADELEALKAAGEQTDLISIRTPEQFDNLKGYYLMYPECIKRSLLMSLNLLLEEEKGETLKKAVTQTDLKRAEYGGQVYGVSAVLPPSGYVAYSREQMQKYGVAEEELMAPLFENEKLLQKVQNLSGEAPYGILSGDVRRELGLWITEPSENLVLTKDGTFGNVTETPEFKERLTKLLEWKEKGLLRILDGSQEEMCFAQQGGSLGMYFSDQAYSGELLVLVKTGAEKESPVFLVPSQTQWDLAPYWGDVKQCIASWTKKQELAEDFLIRLMSDPDIANLIQYGRIGEEYTLEDGKVKVEKATNIYLQLFGGQYTNPLITYPTSTMAKNKLEYAAKFHETYESGIPDGFRFDPKPVIEQVVKTNQVFGNSSGSETAGKIIRLEIEDTKSAVADITAELKAAGIDDVVEEANRQLREWKLSKQKGQLEG